MGVHRNYSIGLDDPTVIDSVEKLIVKVCNLRNLNYKQAVEFIFMQGFEYLITKDDFSITDGDEKLNRNILIALEKEQLKSNRDQHLFRLLESYGEEKFIDWCKTNGVNHESIIANSEELRARNAADQTRKMSVWLHDYLADMLPHSIEEVLRCAQIDGLLPDAILYENEYKSRVKTLQNIASSAGYSSRSKRGVWQKKLS